MPPAPETSGPPTPSQQRAVAARGNVLVMAGAGTGKTKTLVDRCLHCLENGAQIDGLLIVTFTEAAAAGMRQRLCKRLEEKTAAGPGADFWAEQLARFDLAHIGTLHSFCLRLVREHFYELGLDPQPAILDEGEARQLARETLDEQFTAHYEGKKDFSAAVLELVEVHGGGRDENIRKLVLRLHQYSQARPDAAGWLAGQRAKFAAAVPGEWESWLLAAIAGWRDEWRPALEKLSVENEKAAELAGILSRLEKNFSRESAAAVLAQALSADGNWPARRKTVLRQPLADFFAEAKFLSSLAAVQNGSDPLAEDWSWVRGQMGTLVRLAEEFAEKFAAAKRAAGALDFSDLEQFALKLLWDFSQNRPTAVAESWRAKLEFVFVDEYQDINAAQDKIIAALAREGKDANRFLVGDVKQSIYRFRLADPQIFRDYADRWHPPAGETIPLAENFRSRESLLDFVNSLFRTVMRAETGGINYDADAELKFGAPQTRGQFSAKEGSAPGAELLVRFKAGRNESLEAEDAELAGLGDAEREARLAAWRLKQFVADRHEIFDDGQKIFRPVEWRDMAVLLRSPRGQAEVFAQEFERAGVPLAVARGGFYGSAEILDLISLLQLLDNPLQDVPCIAVLRSPLVGLSLDELAEIRLAAREKYFWTALNHWAKVAGGNQKVETAAKVSRFLERFSRWRKLAKQVSLSQCLEAILAETLYADWLRAQPRGGQRAANVAGFLQLAQKFDQFQRQGLFRFLKFIAAQQESGVEPEVPAAAAENAVRLMSIHQSKGLEFPVVVLAGLARNFNEADLRGDIIFDAQLGLCPKIRPPSSGRRYPSLPHWLAQRRQRRELRGEELRLLYVALTRARDSLVLTASVTQKNWEEKWAQPGAETVQTNVAAKNFADWLQLWFSNQTPAAAGQSAGEKESLRWRIVADAELAGETEAKKLGTEMLPPALDAGALEKLGRRLAWKYPLAAATKRKAKVSVTELRRAAEATDDEAKQIFPQTQRRKAKGKVQKLTSAETGLAHHIFLQHLALDKTAGLAAEAGRLEREKFLSAEQCAALDLAALADFWNSELGRKILANAENVRRELPFTARFSPAEIAAITGQKLEEGLENEFVVVQGVADLAVVLPDEIWLVDFKTDAVGETGLPEKIAAYRPQLRLYAAALEKVFARRVNLCALHFLAARRTELV